MGEPAYFSVRGQRIETVLSVFGIAIIWGVGALWLNAQQWIGLGLTIGVASVFIIGAAFWRLIV